MAKLQITTEEAQIIIKALNRYETDFNTTSLRTHINEENDRFIPCIHGLPSKEQLSEEGIEFLDRHRIPYIGYYTEGEDKPYSIFESLGEEAGSDDEPVAEFETYEDMQKFWEMLDEQYNNEI